MSDMTTKNKFYFCAITELQSGYEYPSHILVICPNGQDVKEICQSVCLEYRGDGVLCEDGKVDFGNGLLAYVSSVKEITKEHFEVLRNYLSVH